MLFFSFSKEQNTAKLLVEYASMKYPNIELNEFIYVGIKRQKLFHIKNDSIIAEFDVSTAKDGAGCEAGSKKTPIGLHEIRRKVGDNVPENGIFKFKEFDGNIAQINTSNEPSSEDFILTRIITLRGLEENINKGEGVDSYARAIYIHGTADEGLIGKPASHGCVRMRNKDIIALYDSLEEGMKVILFNN